YLSTYVQNENLGGIGLFRVLSRDDVSRNWFSWLGTSYRSGITLPPYVNNYGTPATITVNISASTNASPIQITTSSPHVFNTNDIIVIANHLVNTNANGTWTITRVDATNFTLNTSTGNGVGGATGTATRTISISPGPGVDYNGHVYVAWGRNIFQLG